MTVSRKKQSGVALKIRFAPDLYRQAARRASGLSLHNYLTHLVYHDLGLDPDSQGETLYARPGGWNVDNLDPDRLKQVQFIVSRQLHNAITGKLGALPYPVRMADYLRRLVERDLAERKVRLPIPDSQK